MNNKYYLIIIVILVILNVFSWRIWWRYPPVKQPIIREMMERGKGRRDVGGMRFLEDKLNLDENQKHAFEQLRIEYFADIKVVNDELMSLRKELMNHLMKEEMNVNKDSIFQRMARQKMKFEMTTFKHFSELRNLCNKEQKVIYDTLFVHMMSRADRFSDYNSMKKRHRKAGGVTDSPHK